MNEPQVCKQPELRAWAERILTQSSDIHSLLNDLYNRMDGLKDRDESSPDNPNGEGPTVRQNPPIVEQLQRHSNQLSGAINKLNIIYSRLAELI